MGFDLQSILTHEAGHFLGLAHSPDAEATMAAQYYEGTTTFRSLAADDVAAVCAAYPPKAIDVETCNPIPRHGFSELCAADQAYASCALGSPPSDRGALAACAAALGCLAARAKRGNLRRR